jgi:hypothetical protein
MALSIGADSAMESDPEAPEPEEGRDLRSKLL